MAVLGGVKDSASCGWGPVHSQSRPGRHCRWPAPSEPEGQEQRSGGRRWQPPHAQHQLPAPLRMHRASALTTLRFAAMHAPPAPPCVPSSASALVPSWRPPCLQRCPAQPWPWRPSWPPSWPAWLPAWWALPHRGRPAWGDQAVCRCRVALVRFQLLTALLMRGCPLLQVHPPIDANCTSSACRSVRNRAGRAGQAHRHLQAHLRRCLGPTRACPPRPPHRPAPPSQQQLHPPLPPRCLACRRAAAPLGRG